MFEFLIIPGFITASILTALTITAVIMLSRRGWRLTAAVIVSTVVALVASIPLGGIVAIVVAAVRYGTFEYDSAAAICDYNIDIPPSATNITLNKTVSGHKARFTITERELTTWIGTVIAKRANEPMVDYVPDTLTPEDFDSKFGQMGWEYPPDNYGLFSPISANGAGFLIWYSPVQQMAYMDAGYW